MFQQIGGGDSNNMNTNMKMKMNMHVLSQEVQNHQWPSSSSSSSSSSSFTSQAKPDGMRQSQDLDINRVCPLPLPLSLEEMVSPPLREASSWPPLLPAQLSYNNASMQQLNVAGDCSKDKEFPPFLQYDSNNSNTNNSSSSCDMLTPSSPTTSQVLQQASPPTHSPPSNQLLPFLISNNSPSRNHTLLEPVSSELTQDKGSIPRITTCVVEDKEPSNDHSSEDGEVVNNSSKKAKNLGSHSQGVLKKEKLGDKITALQQLVSPFGKTDTASVLLEAIGYIKFLQDQVQVLSSPYMKSTRQDTNGYSASRTSTGTENQGAEDLRSRGLCLVPVSCTSNMANNNGADYWASGMGGGSSSRYS